MVTKKENTPSREARRRYEQKNKDKRQAASGNFQTMIPREKYEEISAFLKTNNITKGRLVTKNGKYYVVISYQDEHGRNKQKWAATGLDAKNNKRAAEEVMRNIVAKFNNEPTTTIPTKTKEQPTSPDKLLFGDYLLQWIEVAKMNLQLSTYAAYKNKIKHIAPYFNERGITLQSIRPNDIQNYYAWLMEQGKTVQACTHAHVIIRRALEIAYRTDLIPVNPAAKVEKPKSPKYEARYYDLKQLKTLFRRFGIRQNSWICIATEYYRQARTCRYRKV